MAAMVHTVHVLLAGVWVGGVIFTTAVVSPALKAMKWTEIERVGVRSVIGRRYALVGNVNLVLFLIFALLDGAISGFGSIFYAEYALIAVVFLMVAAHGAYFGRRLASLAAAEAGAQDAATAKDLARRRRSLQKISLQVSRFNLAVSVVVMVLAINAA